MEPSNLFSQQLDAARDELLDLSARNRLLNTPLASSRSGKLAVVDELGDEVFRKLIRQRQPMSFLPSPESAEQPSGVSGDAGPALCQPEDEANGQLAARHTDDRLQTGLNSAELQKRLLKLSAEARTFLEEQGVNSLYLAIGFLEWYEAPASEVARFAPLVLVPAQLNRKNAKSRFQVSADDSELLTNLSLQAMLQKQFGLRLPELPEGDEWLPSAYFKEVEAAVADQPRWKVHGDRMVLWFFSFGKYLMYRDLLPETWPAECALNERSLVAGLLSGSAQSSAPLCGDDEKLDGLLAVSDLEHVVDADSSQTVAIEEVKRGRNLVIQGPPGTGKSQTIVNLIAGAVMRGKKVLFLAEKMAALEVVKSWLEKIELGSMCLELHSQKAKKKDVLEELGRTMSRAEVRSSPTKGVLTDLERSRQRLNEYADVLHKVLEPSRLTPFQVMSKLSALREVAAPPVEFKLPGALSWSTEEFVEQEAQVARFAAVIGQLGCPLRRAWRGIGLRATVFTDVQRLQGRLSSLNGRLVALVESARDLSQMLGLPAPTQAAEVGAQVEVARRLGAAPALDPAAVASDVWREQRTTIAGLLEHGQRWKRCRDALNDVTTAAAWREAIDPLRRTIASHGTSWLCFLRRDYREAMATLRGLMKGALPSTHPGRLRLLDALAAAQEDSAALARDADGPQIGRRAFGRLWQGAESDWKALGEIEVWERGVETDLSATWRQALVNCYGRPEANEACARVGQNLAAFLDEATAVFDWLRLDLPAAFGQASLALVPFSALSARMTAWHDEPDGLGQWIAYCNQREQGLKGDAAMLAEQMHQGVVDPRQVVDQFRLCYYETVMRSILERCPQLAAFDSCLHQQQIADFQRLDKQRLTDLRQEAALAHDRIRRSALEGRQMAIIRGELEKKRRHKAVRQLLKEAGTAVQALKPVFMMSPISVAQFLEPGALEFDLLVIDEASQVRPVDALGAIARAYQIVVVGDSRQLPPTQFFCALADDNPDDEAPNQESSATDMESILSLCVAKGLAQRMLRWHYRSQHHSLIAVSNREFYDDKLYIVPSSGNSGRAAGLQFRHVSDGVFDRGGSATNRREAQLVAEAVMEHARKWPGRSLGVGTFSMAQCEAIRDELEVLRRLPENSAVESFFAEEAASAFFVKNLENIQGDERDVIFISVGYARNAEGYMAMGFGPLSRDGGERRLNVLITRAREECVVFSSITADDIDLTRARSRGAAALKTFLSYARSGILDVGKPTGRDFDSDFERQVAREVQALGYGVEAQVGVAGFFIDLAVRDPLQPGRYLLGIECDGAAYHSSRSARDRDRLRQQVLESRGWKIHRVWSTDWFQRHTEQVRKIKAALEAACSAGRGELAPPLAAPPEAPRPAENATIPKYQLVGSFEAREQPMPGIVCNSDSPSIAATV